MNNWITIFCDDILRASSQIILVESDKEYFEVILLKKLLKVIFRWGNYCFLTRYLSKTIAYPIK